MQTNEADIRNSALEEAAYAAEHWGDLYSVGVGIAAGIRADAPFTFADPRSQAEWERQRKERGE